MPVTRRNFLKGALVLAGSGVVWASDRLGGVRDSFGAIFAESGPSVPPSESPMLT